MNDPKPLASLSGNLLARKGAARPAMRPQVQRLANEDLPPPPQLDDLGWDDMGEHDDHLANRAADILPLTPAPLNPEAKEETLADDRAAAAQLAANARMMISGADVPEVVRQQDMIAERLAAAPKPVTAAPAKPAPAKKVAAPKARTIRPRRKVRTDGRRAAFTLRLDELRHLKLRLACTIQGRSAQQLVTSALDHLLEDMPELELLAAQVKPRGADSAN